MLPMIQQRIHIQNMIVMCMLNLIFKYFRGIFACVWIVVSIERKLRLN